MNELESLKNRVKYLEDIVLKISLIDRYYFQKDLELLNGRNIRTGKTTGSSFGNTSTDKISFYGETPVVQAGAISAPSGGATQDTEARTAINSIRTALSNIGITA